MDLKITNKQENTLLSRTEITAEAAFFGFPTPSKQEIVKKIAGSEKADEKLIVIKKIENRFGNGKAKVSVYVYKTEEDLEKTEPKKKDKAAAPKAEEKKE
ncbi:MAG TPA: hypothetical protein VFF28_05300 [Candidatus Nanoarchaeia archaeon]|nr:hypothetical protein [Candidatus Nanoarchaeia archaeon]